MKVNWGSITTWPSQVLSFLYLFLLILKHKLATEETEEAKANNAMIHF
jgi:hypothetical protein